MVWAGYRAKVNRLVLSDLDGVERNVPAFLVDGAMYNGTTIKTTIQVNKPGYIFQLYSHHQAYLQSLVELYMSDPPGLNILGVWARGIQKYILMF
jgi:hypothetical protein